jgi:hypothetical protein
MNTTELAKKIYNHVNGLNRNNEHWDVWDDEREIEFIRSLIDNHRSHSATPIPKFKDEWGNVDWRDTGEMRG